MAENKVFVPTEEAKGKARQFRAFAILAWVIAIAGEIYAITSLLSDDKLTWLIVAIVAILALAITGSTLWKKANRMDPASEKDKFRFFVQNQLGAIMAVLAFLPLVIMIFTNKDLDKKTKGIAGAVAVVALLVAGLAGIDYDPPSIEKYTEQINSQTAELEDLTNGVNHVYWTTKAGEKYHIYSDCQHIKGRDIAEGSVMEAWEYRKIGDNQLCLTCKSRAQKAKSLAPNDVLHDVIEEVTQ